MGSRKPLKELDFNPIKSKRKFLENYELSDRAAQMGDEMLRKNGFTPLPFGEDRRNEPVWEVGKDKPDRKILKDGREIALVDWKGKSKDYWMINERAYNGYLEWSSRLKLPVYVAIWSFESGLGKFIRLPAGTVSRKTEWDRNPVVIFDPKDMGSWKDLAAELNTL